MEKKQSEELNKVIAEMQELVDDKGAMPEMRSNARSYIRGVKKAIEVMEKQT